MTSITRRSFLAAAGTLSSVTFAARALGGPASSGETEVIIIGAGAAGIAAARRVAAP